MKRKAEAPANGKQSKKVKKGLSSDEAAKRFRKGLLSPAVRKQYAAEYAASAPYKHAVIHGLVNDELLRAVRDEIRDNVSFTPKETDIYKIHQSGDLANLDGLEDAALAKLPSLLALRDALYSQAFRDYVSDITGCGALSGRKTDMAINVYTPGCYLLCHDDVIGSRKVSYILYLTDPDRPWQPEWGGALRLFPVVEQQSNSAEGQVSRTPGPDPVKIIPPAWNQLSFFAVQPGESFHDVEEVYHASGPEQLAADGGRVRMAISGWFHIPQPGEGGYVEGAEEAQLKNSGLVQLQGNPDQHDLPQPKPVAVATGDESDKDKDAQSSGRSSQEFNEQDLDFLLKYISPHYLTPDMLEGMASHFSDNSSITLPTILKPAFAERLRKEIVEAEAVAAAAKAESSATPWHVARPPHKHRFLYLQQGDAPPDSAWHELLDVVLPSMAFRTWLEMATDTTIKSYDVLARRFRRGKDYTLATGHEGESQLEINLGLTPTEGWGDVDEEADEGEEEEDEEEEDAPAGKGKQRAANLQHESLTKAGNGEAGAATRGDDDKDEDGVGGHEVYMAGDEDDNDDAAIYRSSSDDDNILFFQAAAWNKMTIVLRDSGTLRFVKYVSRRAPGDRWDVSATFSIEPEEEGEDDDEEDDDGDDDNGEGSSKDPNSHLLDSSSEEEFRGFSDSEDSDSD